jgi:lipopolysaccharide transport system ATP-binding protein
VSSPSKRTGPDPAVSVEGLGKTYRIDHLSRASTLREAVQGFVSPPFAGFRSLLQRKEKETIWALRDVSFSVERGEILGIVGRNGAGKSTLLRILSRITYPTTGYADVYGRLSSLLEVGTGFHPDLTGRDNVFLNGAVLGMRRRETARKFDEIVEFAGVEKFIDTPVKRYSSGMYMRLAFAVAAHLDPDVLVVDEVLSVGDAEFQKRSLGKMRDVTGDGRTVLFVSHNMGAVKALCDRAILLRDGRLIADGHVDQVLADYLSSAASHGTGGLIPEDVPRTGTQEAVLKAISLVARDGRSLSQLYFGQPFSIVLELDSERPIPDAVLEVGISTMDEVRVATSFSADEEPAGFGLPAGRSRVALGLEVLLLPRRYTIDIGIHHGSGRSETIDSVQAVLDFDVLNVAEEGSDPYRAGEVRGYFRPEGRWSAPEPVSGAVESPGLR